MACGLPRDKALAYAAQLVSRGKKTVYLDLEPFSSTPVYFADPERGLTDVFEKLDGNLELLFQSIRRRIAAPAFCTSAGRTITTISRSSPLMM